MRTLALALALAVPALLDAQSRTLTAREQSALADLGQSYAVAFDLKLGWYKERPIRYYDIGPVPVSAPVVIIAVQGFSENGAPIAKADARPIFSTLPELDDYSGIWRVQFLVVDAAQSMTGVVDARSATQLVLRGVARVQTSSIYASYPIVPSGSSLEGDPAQRVIQHGWFKGVPVPYFDFGRTTFTPVPLFRFVTSDSAGAPVPLAGQHNIVDRSPGADSLYSDLWDIRYVHVDARYVAQSWRSWSELQDGAAAEHYSITSAGQVRNCPIVSLDGQLAARPPVVIP